MSVGRNAAWVVFDDEGPARLASLRRAHGPRTMLVPGDLVEVRALDDEHVVVERREARTSTVERLSAGGRRTVMAANIDLLVVVAALVDPPLRLELIDRLIAFAEHNALEPCLIFTKADLAVPGAAASVAELYAGAPLGYRTLIVNPRAGEGLEPFRAAIAGRHALLVGQSGVGKSSLFSRLGGTSVIGEVSRTGRGRQTTSATRLFRLGAGFLIDSPGFGEFLTETLEAAELAACFREFREPASACRFADCRHLAEPGCGVRAAVAAGRIPASRHASYAAILTDQKG